MTGRQDTAEGITIPPGAVMEPGSSLDTETGSWRSSRPVIDDEACTGCGRCVTFCPDGVVKSVDNPGDAREVAIDYRYCKGCGICEVECPVDAIDMIGEVS